MPAEGSEAQFAHRARKRALGECIYGGCHKASEKGSMCLAHYKSEYERKLAGKLKHLSDLGLFRSLARHERAIRRIKLEIDRRDRARR